MFKKTKERIRRGIDSAVTPTRQNISGLASDFRGRIAALKAQREADLQPALEADFEQVLSAWGIQAEDLPRVVTLFKVRLCIFALPLLFAVALLASDGAGPVLRAVGAVLCIAVSLVGCATTAWRLYVLMFKEFIPFWRWIGGLFLLKK